MRTSIWFRTEEKQPDDSGYYFTYRGWGIAGKADGDEDYGYLYYYAKTNTWYEYAGEIRSMHPNTCIVYYWSDADPHGWVNDDPPSIKLQKLKEEHNVALESAYKDVLIAIDKYNMIKELVK